MCVGRNRGVSWNGFDTSEGVFVNTEHDTTPIMVHFNGGKTNFLPVARHLARRRPPGDDAYVETRRRVRRRHPPLATNRSTTVDETSDSSDAVAR